MSAKLLDGRALAQRLKDELKAEVERMAKAAGRMPCIVNIMTASNAAASTYANAQEKTAQLIGIKYQKDVLSPDISQAEFNRHIQALNRDKNVHGILVHKPVGAKIDYRQAANLIDINKDLEGVNVVNIGKMLLGETRLIPCTPAAVMELLDVSGVDLAGKEVVVVGHSEIVGKPLCLLLLNKLATVTVCHIGTSRAGRLKEHVAAADVLIVAVGKPGLIPGEWVKKDAIVIDVGINQVGEKIVGDVDFEGAQKRAAALTPVPGGVGPVTVVMLMRNVLEAFKLQNP